MAKKKKILIADTINKEGIDILKKQYNVIVKDNLNNDQLAQEINYYKPEILIVRSFRKVNTNFLNSIEQNSKPEIICTASTGTDNLDINELKKLKIKYFNIPKGNYISAAEHTIALILIIYKRLIYHNLSVKSCKFDNNDFDNVELYGKTIGVIGVGKVGLHVSRIAKGFGMHITGNDIKDLNNKYKWISFSDKEELFRSSDIITVHTPLDNSTYNMITGKEINAMKKNAVLINCARGGIINEKDLIRVLKNKRIFYAGLDVFENEPGLNKELLKLNNVILTPHVAGKTRESHRRISIMLAEKLVNLAKDTDL